MASSKRADHAVEQMGIRNFQTHMYTRAYACCPLKERPRRGFGPGEGVMEEEEEKDEDGEVSVRWKCKYE